MTPTHGFRCAVIISIDKAKDARKWCVANAGRRGVDWHVCLDDGRTQRFLLDSEANAVELKMRFG